MRRRALVSALLVAAVASAAAEGDAEKRIRAVVDEISAHDPLANVPPEDGKMLRVLAESTGARRVVELGTSTGASALWFCLALARTGGTLETFEINSGRAAAARANFKKAGVEKMVRVVVGDAHVEARKLKGPIDLLFLDADKDGYKDYLEQLGPLVRPGGLILAHNIDSAPDYIEAVTTGAAYETVLFNEGEGLSITLKKR